MADVHFDIPEPIRRIECCSPRPTTAASTTPGPSEDFERPGRMWWSVPDGIEEFPPWREVTTVFHEGVPGHHLQVAQTAYRKRHAQPLAAADVLVSAATARAGRSTPSG